MMQSRWDRWESIFTDNVNLRHWGTIWSTGIHGLTFCYIFEYR